MKFVAIILMSYLCLALQVAVAPALEVQGVRPQFLLLAIIAAGLMQAGWKSIVGAAIAGFLADCLSGGPLGLATGLSAVLTAIAQPENNRRRPAGVLLLTAGCALLAIPAALDVGDAWNAGRMIEPKVLLLHTASTAAFTLLIGVAISAGGMLASRLLPVSASRTSRSAYR